MATFQAQVGPQGQNLPITFSQSGGSLSLPVSPKKKGVQILNPQKRHSSGHERNHKQLYATGQVIEVIFPSTVKSQKMSAQSQHAATPQLFFRKDSREEVLRKWYLEHSQQNTPRSAPQTATCLTPGSSASFSSLSSLATCSSSSLSSSASTISTESQTPRTAEEPTSPPSACTPSVAALSTAVAASTSDSCKA